MNHRAHVEQKILLRVNNEGNNIVRLENFEYQFDVCTQGKHLLWELWIGKESHYIFIPMLIAFAVASLNIM